jgi:hypothetical protein
MSDGRLDDALRALAGQAERNGRLPDAADLHERGRARRRRRRAATTALVVLLAGGVAAAQVGGRPRTGPSASGTPSPPTDPLLSGTREVAVERGPGSAVSLDGGSLAEVDDDSGRQLFVLTPLGGGEYLIKAFGGNVGHPASDEPACWQVHREAGRPATVQGAVCDPEDPDQRFVVTPQTPGTYAIGTASAYLRKSAAGLILDAPLRDTFRLTDRGPARKPAGG